MLFRQMQYFITIVECNSYTEAAEKCFISQSAISQAINSLEEELGVKLTKRNGRKFVVTPAGQLFYQRSKEILKSIDKAKKDIQKEYAKDEFHLTIGYLSSYEGVELSNAILKFSKLHPQVIVHVFKGSHEDLYYALKNGEASIVLNDQRRAFSDEYENFILHQSPAYVDVSKEHPLAQNTQLYLKELEEYPCILVASKKREATEKDFYENTLGIGKKYVVVENLDEAQLLAMSGRGYLLVESIKKNTIDPLVRLEVRRNDNSPIVRTYCAFWKKSEANTYIESFAELLRAQFFKS
ncbi:MAG: LysR family transcriptional regulator [Anaeroplasmataceae bacterium]|nr:LysR family transcriptional regulator [Anaeroplasmataceae bacterium]